MELIKKKRNSKSLIKHRDEKVPSKEREANQNFIKLVEEQLLISFFYEISGSSALPLKADKRLK